MIAPSEYISLNDPNISGYFLYIYGAMNPGVPHACLNSYGILLRSIENPKSIMIGFNPFLSIIFSGFKSLCTIPFCFI